MLTAHGVGKTGLHHCDRLRTAIKEILQSPLMKNQVPRLHAQDRRDAGESASARARSQFATAVTPQSVLSKRPGIGWRSDE